ncbi:MAG: type II and III secretion system protein [Deltaproteobacteria bacterium]|nr:MAG: type II and III secretion system protein [Deltaproteobacteria bacterium]
MGRMRSLQSFQFLVVLIFFLGGAATSQAQPRRHIKVVLETKQAATSNREIVQGSGGVVIRRGTVNPSGRIIANDRQTSVQRSSGIFTVVLDGGESILTVRIVFNDVGTSLRVNAATQADGQIKLRLTPRISYFSTERPGAIDFTEAATELIVPNGQAVSLGGSTTKVHELTRQILGYRDRASSDEISLVVTATLQ